MPKIKGWEISGTDDAIAYINEDSAVVVHQGLVIAAVRFTSPDVLIIDGDGCTAYIKPETKTIVVSSKGY
ncbi:MAG: hypothetical protein BWY80_01261 [Firmicutes bacterium ADurb.Bin456]|nr:MAG: hypothetical protein BWY80_01261 [Firmicutes bacterium ADurb.Bin456]